MLMALIPSRMHALLDYAVGVVLIAAPWIFQFADESTTATWISIVAGIGLIGMSALTAYEGGFIAHVIPLRIHLVADALLGIVLAVSPWLFGFADDGANAWAPFLVIGLGELGAAAVSSPEPGQQRTHAGVVHT
jgi:hypothetical protein